MLNVTTANLGPLAAHLMDLAGALAAAGQPLVLIGGFGLLLRRAYREQRNEETFLETLPDVRTTNDFDVVLGLEILADPSARQAITTVLTSLNYQDHARYFQFIKPATGLSDQAVKVDFLTPLPPLEETALKVKGMRVGAAKREEGESPLHAYATPELIALDAPSLTLEIHGPGTDGQPQSGSVTLPHPFTLILMKLHAFGDEHEGKRGLGPRPAYAKKHALDVLTLAGLLTPEESDQLPSLRQTYIGHSALDKAGNVVDQFFSLTTSAGIGYLRPPLQARSEEERSFIRLLRDTYSSAPYH